MNRQQKETMVTVLNDHFSTSAASFVVGVSGLRVEQLETLRKQLRQAGAQLKVTKVRIMKRATTEIESVVGINAFLKNQVALVFAKNEVSSVAKLLTDFSKQHEKMLILGGCMDSSVLFPDMIHMVASLPSREVLLGQVAGTLQAPIVGFAVVLNQMLARLVYALKAIEEQKQAN